MLHKNAIGTRIKGLRKKSKFSQQFVAESLFISQAAYSLIENSRNGIVAEHVIGLSNLYDVTTDYILKGDSLLIEISPEKGFIPYIEVKAHAGFIKNAPGDLKDADYEWYRIPNYNQAFDHRLFEVEGMSMAPTLFPGDVLICQKHSNPELIPDGSLVLVVTKDSLLVKRFRKTEEADIYILENDNPEEMEEMSIRKKKIIEVMIVRGKISNLLEPQYFMDAQHRLSNMEEALHMLKKELHDINKKLDQIR